MAFLTVSGAPSANGSAARAARTTSNAMSPRLRRDRDLPYLRPLSGVAFRALLPRNLRPELLGLPLESIRARVVLYHDVGPASLLLRRQLARLYCLEGDRIHAALGGPGPLPFPRHDHGNGVVEILSPPRLEQERYLDHEHLAAAEADQPVRLVVNEGMEDTLELCELARVAEDDAPERLAVYPLLAEHTFAEALGDLLDGGLVPPEQVVDYTVSRGRVRAEFAEHPDEGALARRKRAGDRDGHRPFFVGAPVLRAPDYFSSRSRSERASKAPVRRPLPSEVPRPRSEPRSGRSSRRGGRSSRWRGGRSARSSRSSRFGRRESERRRRFASTSMMRASTSSPERTISSGVSTWCSASSEMWIRPSTPSATSTKAPKETSLVTRPGICYPTFTRSTISCHGSLRVCLRPSEILSRSRSTSRTLTSTSSPTSTTSLGWSTWFQESSLMWMSPSMPSRSTNAPKSTRFETVPSTISPSCSVVRMRWRSSLRSSSSTALRLKTTLLRLRLSSMTLHSKRSPKNASRLRTRRISTRLAGRNPRKPMSRIRPPLTTSMTGPSTVRCSWCASSMRCHAFSKAARLAESMRRPSWSSFWRTRASMCWPSSTISCGSTPLRMESSLEGIKPSDLYPMSTSTSSLSMRTMSPSTMSPSLKSTRTASSIGIISPFSSRKKSLMVSARVAFSVVLAM